ncbi:hypothetical protein DFH11DRAFT_1502486 [Phellopilus nigrolimitatus]|nr:hypothetical protein DFH11DRAFT_1502486 [Phellopilus nigrolimitatus]
MALPQPASNIEKLKEFDSVPLFMRSLPNPDEHVDDTAINALQSLVHDGTPDEIAHNFKEQGNGYFKGKRYREAVGFYTQAIDAKPEDASLVEALLCNRAACNLELQNYGSVLRDCSKAITQNPECSKAYYRSAHALLSLERPEDALDACVRCLNFDPDNAGVKALRNRVLVAKKSKEEKEKTRLERMSREETEKRRLRVAFKERGLIDLRQSSVSPGNDSKPHFDEDSNATRPSLVLPTFFLYPQYSQSDVVPNFHEDTTFSDQLSNMFPPNAPAPDWDMRREYAIGKLAVYAITHSKRLLKVGMKMTLRDLCNTAKLKDGKPDGLDLRDGYASFVVVPKGKAEQEWVNEFKSSRDRDS